MFTALITFLGSTFFRLAVGHLFEYFDKAADHKFEMERLKLDAEAAQANHVRQMEALKLQSDLNIQQVRVKADADLAVAEEATFSKAIEATQSKSGVAWVDAWNGMIRPLLATIAISVWVGSMATRGFVLTPFDTEIISASLGLFVGGRIRATGR